MRKLIINNKVISISREYKKDSLTEEDLEEILRLKNEINEKINRFNENASPKDIETINIYKEKLKNQLNHTENIGKDLSQKKKQNDEKNGDISFTDKSIRILTGYLNAIQTEISIDPGRIMGLTDGIFGMVMTLLIFAMALPEMELLTAGDFLAFVQSTLPTFGITLVSFILIASFWIYHHEFIKLNSLNIPYLWINILFLAGISFIPFTTSIIGFYSRFFLADVLFGLNILITLILFLAMFKYADHMNFLEKEVSEIEKKYTYNTLYIIMGLTVIVNLLDFNVSQLFIYLFLLVPIISIIRDTKFKLNHK